MIKTKIENEKENKIRDEIEALTKEIIQVTTKRDNLQRDIDRLPAKKLKFLKDMVNDRVQLDWRINYLEEQRNDKINLLNSIA